VGAKVRGAKATMRSKLMGGDHWSGELGALTVEIFPRKRPFRAIVREFLDSERRTLVVTGC